METKKANTKSTVEGKESIDKRAEWHPETREFWGHIWVCENCGDRDTRGPDHIDHTNNCPNAGTEVTI